MRKLETAEGVTPDQVRRLEAGILALAGLPVQPPAEVNEEAAKLARETPYAYQVWCRALAIVGDRPNREAVVKLMCDLIARGSHPEVAASYLFGDGITPGILDIGRASGGTG